MAMLVPLDRKIEELILKLQKHIKHLQEEVKDLLSENDSLHDEIDRLIDAGESSGSEDEDELYAVYGGD